MYKNYGKAKAGRSRAQAGKKKMVKDPKTGKMVPDFAVDGKGPNDRAQMGKGLRAGIAKSKLVEENKEVKFGSPKPKEKAKVGKRRKAQIGESSPMERQETRTMQDKKRTDLEAKIKKAKGTPAAKPLVKEYRRMTGTAKKGRKRGQMGLIKGGLAAGKALLQGKGLKDAAAAGVGAALPGPLGAMAQKGINAVGGGQQDPNAAADPNAAPQQPQDPNATAKKGKKRGLKDRRKSRRKAKMGNYGIEKTASGKMMADTLGVKKNKKGSKR